MERQKRMDGEILMISKTFGKIFCGQNLNVLAGLSFVTFDVKLKVFHKNSIMATVRHGGGSVMAWAALLLYHLNDWT